MEYEVNSETLAIIPITDNQSKVVELNNEYIINNSPYKVMENSCNYFGCSLQGRFDGTKSILGSIYKAPVIVEDSRDIIFFPTISPNLPDNCWISLNNIKKYQQEDFKTVIYFDNNKKIELDVPLLSIENQVLRATRLGAVCKKRKSNKKSDIL